VGKVHHLAPCTLAGDLKLVERVHSVLGILEAKASQGQCVEESRSVSCDLKDRPTFPVGTQIERYKHGQAPIGLQAKATQSPGRSDGQTEAKLGR